MFNARYTIATYTNDFCTNIENSSPLSTFKARTSIATTHGVINITKILWWLSCKSWSPSHSIRWTLSLMSLKALISSISSCQAKSISVTRLTARKSSESGKRTIFTVEGLNVAIREEAKSYIVHQVLSVDTSFDGKI